jgi:hypothetical protein
VRLALAERQLICSSGKSIALCTPAELLLPKADFVSRFNMVEPISTLS